MSDKPEKERSLQAKKELYSILLRKENLTDTEINIMYELSQDDEIQAFLTADQEVHYSIGVDK